MIQFHPKAGTVLVCDFCGLKAPEVVKKRPVIVVSQKLKNRDGLCSVVPLSTTPPDRIMPYHYEMNLSLPPPFDKERCWEKCDMIYTVAYSRLELFKNGRDQYGKRKYVPVCIQSTELEHVVECILNGLGVREIVKNLYSPKMVLQTDDAFAS